MAKRVFISFRYSDGAKYKDELVELFDESKDVINCSENEDRSNLSDETIKDYLYSKLKTTSITIVLITPNAVNHEKNGDKYDDWMYDEIRYSLEDRENNRSNGLIAVYVPEAESDIIKHKTCEKCEKACEIKEMIDIDNLARRNMMNILAEYKNNKCDNIYDVDYDSYCSFIAFEEFKSKFEDYIEIAETKRSQKEKYKLEKVLN